MNVDASFHEENLSGACGVVARDDQGKFLGAATLALPHVSSAGSAELMAIRSGLYPRANLGCTNLNIESDCMNALKSIPDPNAYMGVDVPVVAECSLLAMNFASISYEFCSSVTNMLADGLAKHCFSNSTSEV